MQKWFVMSNCNAIGICNSLSLQNPDIVVENVEIYAFKNDLEKYIKVMDESDKIVIIPEFRDLGIKLDNSKIITIPVVDFSAYQPDICYVKSGNDFVRSPMDTYNSLIVILAYKAGLPVDVAIRLFNRRVYERSGYFDLWASDCRLITDDFARYGWDVSGALNRWGREDAFMYSFNHPKIRMLHDLAGIVLQQYGLRTLRTDVLPHDNLANGPCWPIYPEIGDALGVPGSLLFKRPGVYRYMTLDQFVRGSFEAYDAYDRESLIPVDPRALIKAPHVAAAIAEAVR